MLCVQARLDGVSSDLLRRGRKTFACCDAKLLCDEVQARDRLGDGMLDLDAPVELEEEELVAVDDELDRSRSAVADGIPERHRSSRALPFEGRDPAPARGPPRAPSGGAAAPSSRALPARHGTMPVREQLHLDVTRSARGSARSRASRRRRRLRPLDLQQRAPLRARWDRARLAFRGHRHRRPP